MKSRREMLASLFIDIAKAVFVALVIGKILNPELIPLWILLLVIIVIVGLVVIAWNIQPESQVDKEFVRWK